MHICDGFAIQYCNGSNGNNSGNVNIILRKIDAKSLRRGHRFLGVLHLELLRHLEIPEMNRRIIFINREA